LPIINSLVVELHHRSSSYESLQEQFSFLSTFSQMTAEYAGDAAENLRKKYDDDLDDSFPDEFVQFCKLAECENYMSPPNLCKLIKSSLLQATFSNTDIALSVYLTIPVTNCEGERTFSLPAKVKNELRYLLYP